MRISDWSSDVCSSDLLSEGFSTRAMRALTLRASVRMEPVKPFSVEVNVPMVAIVVFLFSCSGRAPRDLDSCQKTGDDRTAPHRAAMKWRAASRRFHSGGVERRRLPG